MNEKIYLILGASSDLGNARRQTEKRFLLRITARKNHSWKNLR